MEEPCKGDEEVEEGECSDQDDIGMSNTDFVKEPNNHISFGSSNFYRQGSIPQIIINSDQSDQDDSDRDDDDDEYHSFGKRTFRSSDIYQSSAVTSKFINPLRSSEVRESLAEGARRKRKNNVWGAVMTEQILSQDIKHFGVNAPISGSNRDVESYDFTIAKEDDRPEVDVKEVVTEEKEDIFAEVVDLEKDVKQQHNRKRKRNIKDRLGRNAKDRLGERNIHDRLGERTIEDRQNVGVCRIGKELGQIQVGECDDVFKVTQTITDALGEQNVTLFSRIVEAIGKEKACLLYNKTVDVENAGGMLINNGNRRRTPGGVYIQLLKSEPSIPAPVISAVFEDESKKWKDRQKELRKIKKAARKRWKRKEKQQDMDYDRPETPTPTKELEDLDNGNEVDVSDLPDRPDTPEPKDSSDVSEDDEEEEEDIAVVIAKARAAILKKQQEMNEGQQDDEINCGETGPDESVDMS